MAVTFQRHSTIVRLMVGSYLTSVKKVCVGISYPRMRRLHMPNQSLTANSTLKPCWNIFNSYSYAYINRLLPSSLRSTEYRVDSSPTHVKSQSHFEQKPSSDYRRLLEFGSCQLDNVWDRFRIDTLLETRAWLRAMDGGICCSGLYWHCALQSSGWKQMEGIIIHKLHIRVEVQ